MKRIIFLSVLFALSLFFVGCEKCDHDVSLTGKLSIVFNRVESNDDELTISLYNMDNDIRPIVKDLITKRGKLSVEINPGDYVTDTRGYGNVAFQIRQGKTTKIIYDQKTSNVDVSFVD